MFSRPPIDIPTRLTYSASIADSIAVGTAAKP